MGSFPRFIRIRGGALSDASTQIPLKFYKNFVEMILEIWEASKKWYDFEFPD